MTQKEKKGISFDLWSIILKYYKIKKKKKKKKFFKKKKKNFFLFNIFF